MGFIHEVRELRVESGLKKVQARESFANTLGFRVATLGTCRNHSVGLYELAQLYIVVGYMCGLSYLPEQQSVSSVLIRKILLLRRFLCVCETPCIMGLTSITAILRVAIRTSMPETPRLL